MNAFTATREHYRLTQDRWAHVLGVARSTVSAWEGGDAHPPPVILGAYRKLQEPILRGDLAGLDATRAHLLQIAEEAEREAERLNRGRVEANPFIKVVAVSAAAIAIGLLMAYLFTEEKQ